MWLNLDQQTTSFNLVGNVSKQGLWSNPMCDWCLNWKKNIRIFVKSKKIGYVKEMTNTWRKHNWCISWGVKWILVLKMNSNVFALFIICLCAINWNPIPWNSSCCWILSFLEGQMKCFAWLQSYISMHKTTLFMFLQYPIHLKFTQICAWNLLESL